MSHATVLDLADCTEYRQAIQARPPAVVHGTVALLAALLGMALGWAALTRANLVVRGAGRIRPVTTPVKVYNAVRGEALSASVGGRVAEVHVREGDQVCRGQVVIRLETGHLDNEIARKARLIRAAEEELARLDRFDAILTRQYETARAKAEAELIQAQTVVRRAGEQQAAEVRLARLALKAAEDEEQPLRRLLVRGTAAPQEVLKAATATREAKEKLAKARIPIDESGVAITQRALELAERDHAVKRDELELKRGTKGGEFEAARLELANLELEQQQSIIRAPIDGIVTAGDVKVGDVLEPGKPVLEIAEEAGFRFEAVVSSDDIGHLRTGMPARIKLDAYDYQRYGTLDGTVCFIAPDSGVTKEQKAVVYIVKIAVSRDEVGRGEYRGRIKLGMSGQAEIVTERESLLSLFVKRIRQTISLG